MMHSMNVFQPRSLFHAVLVCTALVTACTNPGYNDNPSQQITHDRAGCPVATEFFAVHFSVRVQPSNENQDARITRELFRPYCSYIPTPGKVFFTADLVGGELRTIPIGIRVVEQGLAGEDESHADNFKDLRTISEVLAKTYSNGVIESHFDVNRNGYYAIYLIKGGEGSVLEKDQLKIPLNVGVNPYLKRLTRIVTLLGIASGIALIAFVAFQYRRRRNAL
jgi:hypothetical protein